MYICASDYELESHLKFPILCYILWKEAERCDSSSISRDNENLSSYVDLRRVGSPLLSGMFSCRCCLHVLPWVVGGAFGRLDLFTIAGGCDLRVGSETAGSERKKQIYVLVQGGGT